MADKELEYQDLKREFDNPAFRNKLKEYYPHRCSNCGSEDNIEYHHVVPLKLGGTNAITNIIPLRHKCHKAAHCGRHMSHYSDFSNSGRKSRATIEENSDVYDMFINGEIGQRKCCELLGYSARSPIVKTPEFKRYIASKGIARVKNIVDVAGTTRESGLVDGAIVGEVQYLDGHVEYITYKDTGKNDIKYQMRNKEKRELARLEKEKADAERRLREQESKQATANSAIREYVSQIGILNFEKWKSRITPDKYTKIVAKVMRGSTPEEALNEILLAS